MAFLNDEQLRAMGFKSLGRNVLLSDKASIYNAANISIGDNSRIDDFCILSAGAGGIEIGRHVHVSCYASLIGQGRIVMEDFSAVSSRVTVFSSTDDFSGACMTNPTVPKEFTNVQNGDVILRKHAIVGAGAVIMPNVEMGEGAVLGALSMATKNCEPFSINIGSPARKMLNRQQDLLKMEDAFNRRHETSV